MVKRIMYAPESPRREAYTPESPRRKTVIVDNKSRVGKILNSLKNIKNISSYKSRFHPIYKYNEYVKSREFVDKQFNTPYSIHRKESDNLHKKYFETHNRTPISPPKEDPLKDVPKDSDHVIITTRVTKNGQIKVTMSVPMEQLMKNYHSKGLKPPVEEYIRALKAFRYPQEYLLKVIEADEHLKNTLDERQDYINAVFGTSKSLAKPKPVKKSIRKIVGVRK